GHNESSRRKPAALARALIIQKEKAVAAFPTDGAPQAPAEDILFDGRAWLVIAIEEEIVGIQHVIAEELEQRAMKVLRATAQDRVDVAAAGTALSRVSKAVLNLEFVDRVRTGQRRVGQLTQVVVAGADALDQKIIVSLALAVHVHADVAP